MAFHDGGSRTERIFGCRSSDAGRRTCRTIPVAGYCLSSVRRAVFHSFAHNIGMLSRCLLIPALLVSFAWADTPMTKLKVEVRTLGDKPIDRAAVIVNFVQGRSVVKLGK